MEHIDKEQLVFLRKMKRELEPADERVNSFLDGIMARRKYNDFEKRILRDIRARWIRQKGLHINNAELEEELEEEINAKEEITREEYLEFRDRIYMLGLGKSELMDTLRAIHNDPR